MCCCINRVVRVCCPTCICLHAHMCTFHVSKSVWQTSLTILLRSHFFYTRSPTLPGSLPKNRTPQKDVRPIFAIRERTGAANKSTLAVFKTQSCPPKGRLSVCHPSAKHFNTLADGHLDFTYLLKFAQKRARAEPPALP